MRKPRRSLNLASISAEMQRLFKVKVKTLFGIKRFQEDKELGSWFGKLLPITSSIDNCQPQQAIEPGRKGSSN